MAKISQQEREESVRLYVSGLDCRSVGRLTGHSPMSVASWVRQAGHVVRTAEETKKLNRVPVLPDADGVIYKICSKCGERRPLISFPKIKDSLDGHRGVCRLCKNQQKKATYPNIKEKVCAKGKLLRKEKPEIFRDRDLRARFKISLEEFNKKLEKQGGVCAACGAAYSEEVKRFWNLDHDHDCCSGSKTCGKCIRGILCRDCNLALGMVKDDPCILRGLLSYLELYQRSNTTDPD